MLSAHEIATLMLVKDAPERMDVDRMELWALRELQLVEMEPPEAGLPMARVTPRGDAVLRAIARVH
ncbi:hypothetical protein [Paraburkholderia tagetis]|uniref:Preprotein translocase subunit SecA n=1 Tax=Paraburkholderia tagetis TaxID=2913261 RepID=A0A9X1ZYG7_9BURK|nr:hypothetical protein [Paraburkholderia tagetis]MCG5078303.1 hypothetical protein [Paraburkholderia tagetis]